jgi:hypothetical protein
MAQPHVASPRRLSLHDAAARRSAPLALGLAGLAAVDLWLLARLGAGVAALPDAPSTAPMAVLALAGAAVMAGAALLLTRLWLDDLIATLRGDVSC